MLIDSEDNSLSSLGLIPSEPEALEMCWAFRISVTWISGMSFSLFWKRLELFEKSALLSGSVAVVQFFVCI